MILMEETQAALKGWTFEVVATDLNDRSVAKAQEGVYNDYARCGTFLPNSRTNISPKPARNFAWPIRCGRTLRFRG